MIERSFNLVYKTRIIIIVMSPQMHIAPFFLSAYCFSCSFSHSPKEESKMGIIILVLQIEKRRYQGGLPPHLIGRPSPTFSQVSFPADDAETRRWETVQETKTEVQSTWESMPVSHFGSKQVLRSLGATTLCRGFLFLRSLLQVQQQLCQPCSFACN